MIKINITNKLIKNNIILNNIKNLLKNELFELLIIFGTKLFLFSFNFAKLYFELIIDSYSLITGDPVKFIIFEVLSDTEEVNSREELEEAGVVFVVEIFEEVVEEVEIVFNDWEVVEDGCFCKSIGEISSFNDEILSFEIFFEIGIEDLLIFDNEAVGLKIEGGGEDVEVGGKVEENDSLLSLEDAESGGFNLEGGGSVFWGGKVVGTEEIDGGGGIEEIEGGGDKFVESNILLSFDWEEISFFNSSFLSGRKFEEGGGRVVEVDEAGGKILEVVVVVVEEVVVVAVVEEVGGTTFNSETLSFWSSNSPSLESITILKVSKELSRGIVKFWSVSSLFLIGEIESSLDKEILLLSILEEGWGGRGREELGEIVEEIVKEEILFFSSPNDSFRFSGLAEESSAGDDIGTEEIEDALLIEDLVLDKLAPGKGRLWVFFKWSPLPRKVDILLEAVVVLINLEFEDLKGMPEVGNRVCLAVVLLISEVVEVEDCDSVTTVFSSFLVPKLNIFILLTLLELWLERFAFGVEAALFWLE